MGVTNHVLLLPGDEYEITLSSGNCSPTSQDIALVGTSLVTPMVVAFAVAESLVAAAAKTIRVPTAPVDLAASAAVASLLRTAKAAPKLGRKTRGKQSKPAVKSRMNE